MVSLRHQVIEHDVQAWAHSFLGELEQTGRPTEEPPATIRLRGEAPSSPEELNSALTAFTQVPRILVATDFDGVLAPIVADRDTVQPDAGALGTLRALADMQGVAVALISGRALADLDSHTRMPSSVVLVGSHGAEVGALPPWMHSEVLDSAALTMTSEKEQLLEAITRTLRRIASQYPGTEVETKPAAAVLHTRNARGRGSINATEAALEYALTLPDVTVTPGKEVVEFSVVHSSKGAAIDALARASAADAWLYLGDDVTDETVFAQLGTDDVGIRVGGGDTAAAYRIGDTADAATLLTDLIRLRRAH